MSEESFSFARKTLQLTFVGAKKGFKRLIAKPIRRADACLASGRITG
jgi:hypothetical protein